MKVDIGRTYRAKGPQVGTSLMTRGTNYSPGWLLVPCIFISESAQEGNLLKRCAGLYRVLPLRTNESPP